MNFKIYLIILLFLLNNCSTNVIKRSDEFKMIDKFSNKGFALIYNEDLFKKKKVSKKMDHRSYLILQRNLKKGSNVKVTNLLNNKSILAKVKSNNSKYPLFFNSVITQRISEDLEINIDEPYVQISLISENSSFIAKKAKTWEEEKEVAEKAPIDGIVINDLSKKVNYQKKPISDTFSYSIKIADFYYKKSALLMIDRIKNETSIRSFKVLPLSKTKFRVILGPFSDIISLKNSYNKTATLNFENIEIISHD